MKFNEGKGKVVHQEWNNPMQHYNWLTTGANWLTAGNELTFKIAQAETIFLNVHRKRQHETWEILTQVTMRMVRCWSRCPEQLWNLHLGGMWGPSGYSPGQPPPSGSAGGWTRRGHSQPVWYFCISNLQLRDTLSLRQFQCKQSFSLFHNPAG